MNYPLILSHIYKERIWGGDRIVRSDPPIGEDWALSVRQGDQSLICNGRFAGMRLADVIGDANDFPLLVKFIDAGQALSIQVHPDDETAARMGCEGGKSEMWYIVDAMPNSCIYLGIDDGADVDELRAAVLRGEDPRRFLKRIGVRAGECYFIPGGTPHAIGGGCYICEIQQNCDTTFRMYDYGRPRELHLNEAAIALKRCSLPAPRSSGVIASSEYFQAELIKLNGSALISAEAVGFSVLTIVRGDAEMLYAREKARLYERDTVYIPAGLESCVLEGDAVMIKTRI